MSAPWNLALALIVAVPGMPVVASQAGDGVDLSQVEGVLVVIEDHGWDFSAVRDEQLAAPKDTTRSVRILLDSGGVIPLAAGEAMDATSGDRFEGTLDVPPPVAAALGIPSNSSVTVDSAVGEDIVESAAEDDAEFTVAEGDVLPVQSAAAAAAHSFDIAVVSFPGSANPTASGTALSTAGTTGSYWVEQSGGVISSFPAPAGVQTYTSNVGCATGSEWSLWNEAASKFSRPIGAYFDGVSGRHLVVILPTACRNQVGLGLGSIGTVHSGGLSLISSYADTLVPTVTHEVGHNLGLGHANVGYCGVHGVNEGCDEYEYQDIYSVMGFAVVGHPGLTALTAPQRAGLGGYAAGQRVEQSGLQRSSYEVLAASSTANGVRAAEVIDPLTGTHYFVEYRNGQGRDANAFYMAGAGACLNVDCTSGWEAGAGVRVMTTREVDSSLDTIVHSIVTDPTDPSWASMAMGPGESFTSRSGAVQIEVVAMGASSATVRISTGGWRESGPAPAVSRTSGADRFSGAVAISQAGYPGGANVVYVTTGLNYPDALSAAPAAARRDAPLLLTLPDSLPSVVHAEITRLAPDRIIVVGGPNSVSAAVVSSLAGIAPVTRVSGADRFEASRNITRDAWLTGDLNTGASFAYVATGFNFPDALSASAAGGALDAPVILVPGTQTTLDPATRQLLVDLGVSSVRIAGGPASVTPQLQAAIDAIPNVSVTRLSGADRVEASLAIARDAFGTAALPQAYIATAYNYPDALAGAALAGSVGAPLIVVPPDCVPRSLSSTLNQWGSPEVELLGGPASLTERVRYLMNC